MRRTVPRKEDDLAVESLVEDVPFGAVPVLEEARVESNIGAYKSDDFDFSETEVLFARIAAGDTEGIDPELVAWFKLYNQDAPEHRGVRRENLPADAFGA